MATDLYNAELTGTANSTTLPTGWTGSGSTGFVTKMNSDGVGIVMNTGTAGSFNDYTHLDLDLAAASGASDPTDYGVFMWYYLDGTPGGETVSLYLRSSADWSNFNNPSTWVRTQIDNTGAVDIRHRLSSSAIVTDATATITIPAAGVSMKMRIEVVGNVLWAKHWDNNTPEPPGWTMGPVTMASSIVTGAGKTKINLLGGSGTITRSARIRQVEVYNLATGNPTTPPPFVATPGLPNILRGRRRR